MTILSSPPLPFPTAFLMLYQGKEAPRVGELQRVVEEVTLLMSGTEANLLKWLQHPLSSDPLRLSIFLQSRYLRHRVREWIGAIYAQESYLFYNPNRNIAAILQLAAEVQQR